MNVEYCQLCKTRISEKDFETQKAYWLDGRPFCKNCAVGTDAKTAGAPKRAPTPSGVRPKVQTHADFVESLETKPGHKPASGLNRAPGSGLNKKPSSGLNKAPGAGLRPAGNAPLAKAPSSGIMKATVAPGSGIMLAHGTSLTKAPGSGLHKSTGSGVRTASAAGTGKTSGLHKSTGSGIRAASNAPGARKSGVQTATTARPPSGPNKVKHEGSGSGAPRPHLRRRSPLRNPESGNISWLPILGCLIALGIVVELILLMRK